MYFVLPVYSDATVAIRRGLKSHRSFFGIDCSPPLLLLGRCQVQVLFIKVIIVFHVGCLSQYLYLYILFHLLFLLLHEF